MSRNRLKNQQATSPYKGVEDQHNYYRVRIHKDGVFTELGRYRTAEQGALIYNYEAPKFFGEFASLNEVSGKCVKNIFAISGKARHGKNELGAFIKEELERRGYSVFQFAFADVLKFLCAQYFGYKGIKDAEDRQILQQRGDMFRKGNPDIFVNILIEILWGLFDEYDFIIITDLRFLNEKKKLEQKFANTVTVRVNRSNFISNLTAEQQAHRSEIELDNEPFNFLINNEGTLEDLKSQALALVNQVLTTHCY